MVSDPKAELRDIASSVRAYLEWQVETGASGIPRGAKRAKGAAASGPIAAAASVPVGSRETQARASIEDARIEDAATARITAERVTTERGPTAPGPTHVEREAGVDRVARLRVLAEEVRTCTKCGLAPTRTNTVFSRGNPDAAICFIGEAPGADEDEQGLPFVGRAGQLLDKMIGAMGLNPETDVYVCNIIKCRPPENRRPTPEETETCIPYLHEQLATISPKVIVALGNTAVASLLGTKLGITKLRGQWKLYRGKIPVMPTYHPSYLIRPSAQQAEAKKQAWEDLQAVLKELNLPIPQRAKS